MEIILSPGNHRLCGILHKSGSQILSSASMPLSDTFFALGYSSGVLAGLDTLDVMRNKNR